jgi:carbon starvation protein
LSLLLIVILSAVVLCLAYRIYGSLLAHLFRLDANTTTPAVSLRDDVDYVPIEPKFLISQHFSAIAAAGPIVGPILAGIMFGWLPALIWILLGSIFIGGVHDMSALVASIRHKARSIAEVVNEHMSRRSYLLFLSFVWIALVYIIVAFTDIVANSLVGEQDLGGGIVVTGGGVASASLLYLMLPMLMGLLLKHTRLSLNWATVIFVPLVGVAIWAGQEIPLDLAARLNLSNAQAVRVWDVLLLAYCFVASMTPMWLLLQPRGHLGGYFLYFALFGGALGLIFGGKSIAYPAFTGWVHTSAQGVEFPMFPLLFITIACGACSGFHSIIASGTTSKQLLKETDAKVIGYGAMLLEAMVAVVSLCCVMMLTQAEAEKWAGKPDFIYARGIGGFLNVLGVGERFGICFGLLAFTTFVYDTLDVCTRLGRYIFEELTGWQTRVSRWAGTALMVFVPMLFVTRSISDARGNPVPVWKHFWPLFGASNQLLAALTLIGVTVWLHRTRKARWVWLVTGLPTLFMYVMSIWSLLRFIRAGVVIKNGWQVPTDSVSWVALVLVGLALMLLTEAVRIFAKSEPPNKPMPEPERVSVAGE